MKAFNWNQPSPLKPEVTVKDEAMRLMNMFDVLGYKVLGFLISPADPRHLEQFGHFSKEETVNALKKLKYELTEREN